MKCIKCGKTADYVSNETKDPLCTCCFNKIQNANNEDLQPDLTHSKKQKKKFLTLLSITVLFFIGAYILIKGDDNKTDSIEVGANVIIESPSNVGTFLLIDKNDDKQFKKFVLAKDNEGIKEMLLEKTLYDIPSGTKAKFIDYGKMFGPYYEVRIIEGNYKGIKGYVNKGSIKRI